MTEGSLPLVDIGVNLTDSSFVGDLDAVVARALAAGVRQMVVTGTSEAESEAALALCERYPSQLFATAGVHPHVAREYSPAVAGRLRRLYREASVVAVGETGLDFNRNFSTPEAQEAAFISQVELACELQLPLFVHERDAARRVFEILKHYRDDYPRAVIHCFTGDKKALYAYLDLDLYIGITGWICDERRGAHLVPLVAGIPAQRLMLETDAPYLLPRDLRPRPKSRRNEPAYLSHICRRVAEHLALEAQQLALQTSANARTFFALPEG